MANSIISTETEMFRGVGAAYTNGRDYGHLETLALTLTTESLEVPQRRTPGGGNALERKKISKAELNFVVLDVSLENLAEGVFGTMTSETSLDFTDVVVEDAKANRLISLERAANITAVKFEDGASYRAAVEGEDYSMHVAGVMPLVDGNFKLTGTYAEADVIEALTQTFPEVEFRATLESDLDPTLVIDFVAYRVALSPLSSLALLGDEQTKLEMTGTILQDLSQPAGKSKFFKMTRRRKTA